MPTISIITCWHGQTGYGDNNLLPDYARAVGEAEVITVDNASEPETAEALAGCGGIYLRQDTNQGFAGGNNIGYAHATGDIIIFLNSDIAADPAWLELVAQDVQDGALYGPSMGQQLVAGRWLPYIEGWCIAATRATWEKLTESASVELIGRTVPEWIGPWDSLAYPGPYWEDNDLCWRALQAGISLVQTQWPIQHKGGRTAGPFINHAASSEANRATFTARVLADDRAPNHGPTYPRYLEHAYRESDIQHHLPLLYSLARGNIVELGTRTGVSTAAFLAGVEERGGHVWSVDLDDCGHLYAGNEHWTFIQGDSTSLDLYNGRACDLIDILFIDTFHCYEQARAELALWSPGVAPGGYILMHDPETFPGVRRAAQEFADAHGWPMTVVLPCNGLAVLRRPEDV